MPLPASTGRNAAPANSRSFHAWTGRMVRIQMRCINRERFSRRPTETARRTSSCRSSGYARDGSLTKIGPITCLTAVGARLFGVGRAAQQSRCDLLMVTCSVYLYIAHLGANVRICRNSGAFVVWECTGAAGGRELAMTGGMPEQVIPAVISYPGSRPLACGPSSAAALPPLPTSCSTP